MMGSVLPVLATLDQAYASGEDDESWLDNMDNWTAPKYSRAQVDKAGEALIGNTDLGGFEYLIVNNWRDSHNYALAKMRTRLKRRANNVRRSNTSVEFIEPLVAQRIKRLASIKFKLARQGTRLSQMQDIGGCRAVGRSIKEVRELVEIYKRDSLGHVLHNSKDYMEEPKIDGYRS